MSHNDWHAHGRRRCRGHDYRKRCLYHIVLNKARGIPDFSTIGGTLSDPAWPPRALPTPTGQIVGNAISALKSEFGHVRIVRRCIMPDHVHIAMYVSEDTEWHLGQIIAYLKRDCTARYEAAVGEPDTYLFEEDYNDTFMTRRNQWQRTLDYISANPRRYLLKKLFPEFNRRFKVVIDDKEYDAYGNWLLLNNPACSAVRVSRSFTPQEQMYRKQRWLYDILNGGVVVGPFIHPDERKVRDWAMANGGKLIMILNEDMPERYKPAGQMMELCAQGRLLVIAAPDNRPTGAGAIGKWSVPQAGNRSFVQYTRHECNREHCMIMNRLAEAIAEGRAQCRR